MPSATPFKQDRWERKLYARGGYQKKKSGRFTKPGYRPRGGQLRSVTQEVDFDNTVETKSKIVKPSWWADCEQGHIITYGTDYNNWRSPIINATTTVTYTGTADYTPVSGNWIWRDAGTSATATGINVSGSGWISIPQTQSGWLVSENLTKEQFEEVRRESRRSQFRARMRAQIEGGGPNLFSKRHRADFSSVSQPEIVALQLLKKMLPEEEWKRYLRYGFIIVQSQITGLDYQIFRAGGHILVYRRGKKMAELCIHVDYKCPPSDRVIAKKIMLEATELEVWLKSNIHYCKNFGCRSKPTINELIALGANEAARRPREPIHIIGEQRPVERVVNL